MRRPRRLVAGPLASDRLALPGSELPSLHCRRGAAAGTRPDDARPKYVNDEVLEGLQAFRLVRVVGAIGETLASSANGCHKTAHPPSGYSLPGKSRLAATSICPSPLCPVPEGKLRDRLASPFARQISLALAAGCEKVHADGFAGPPEGSAELSAPPSLCLQNRWSASGHSVRSGAHWLCRPTRGLPLDVVTKHVLGCLSTCSLLYLCTTSVRASIIRPCDFLHRSTEEGSTHARVAPFLTMRATDASLVC